MMKSPARARLLALVSSLRPRLDSRRYPAEVRPDFARRGYACVARKDAAAPKIRPSTAAVSAAVIAGTPSTQQQRIILGSFIIHYSSPSPPSRRAVQPGVSRFVDDPAWRGGGVLRHSARDEGRRDRVDLLGQECFVATVWSAPPDMSNAEAVQSGSTS